MEGTNEVDDRPSRERERERPVCGGRKLSDFRYCIGIVRSVFFHVRTKM